MRKVQVQPKGINMEASDFSAPEGAAWDMINLRSKNGVIRMVGQKEDINTFAGTDIYKDYSHMYYHPLPDVSNNQMVGYLASSRTVQTHNVGTGVGTSWLILPSGESLKHFSHAGNVLICVATDKTYYLRWDYALSQYIPLPDLFVPNTAYKFNSVGYIQPSSSRLGDKDNRSPALVQSIMRLNAEIAKHEMNGYVVESWVMMRTAWRLFDGSYIYHGEPVPFYLGDGAPYFIDSPDNVAMQFSEFYYGTPLWQPDLTASQKTDIAKYKGLIEAFCVFMSPPVKAFLPSLNYSDTSAGDYVLDKTTTSGGNNVYWYDVPFAKGAVRGFRRTDTFYLADEIPLEELTDITYDRTWAASTVREIQLADYFAMKERASQDVTVEKVTTKDTDRSTILRDDDLGVTNFYAPMQRYIHMPVDQLSHHQTFCEASHVFNQRRHFGNITTILGENIDPCASYSEQFATTVSGATKQRGYATWEFFVEATLETQYGEKVVVTEIDPVVFYFTGVGANIYIKPIVTYPDPRATKLRLYATTGGSDYELGSWDLKPSPTRTYSYAVVNYDETKSSRVIEPYKYKGISLNTGTLPALSPAAASDSREYTDIDRIQVSAPNNPFFNELKNSYTVGIAGSSVKDIHAISLASSEGQFGEFPVYIFTDSGIYAMQQGRGDVLYQSIVPVNTMNVVQGSMSQVENTLVFCSENDVCLVDSGGKVTKLTEILDGNFINYAGGITEYQDMMADTDIADLEDEVWQSNFTLEDFLAEAKTAYNPFRKEIVIFNPDDTYGGDVFSLVFNMQTGQWHKVDEVYYHRLVRGGDTLLFDFETVYSMKSEETGGASPQRFLWQSRPLSLGTGDLKKLHEIVIRGRVDIERNYKLAFHLYGSVNGYDYEILKGIEGVTADTLMHEPILLSPRASARYFIIAISGTANDIDISHLDILLEDLPDKRLRTYQTSS